MRKFASRFGLVILTYERERHILEFHPDVRKYLQHFGSTLADPEMTVGSKHDPAAVICYQYFPLRRRYLAIVVKTGSKPFIITAYVAKKSKGAKL